MSRDVSNRSGALKLRIALPLRYAARSVPLRVLTLAQHADALELRRGVGIVSMQHIHKI